MLNISIDNENAIVENTELPYKWTLRTVDFFGNVYATLEKHFPDFKCEAMGAIIVARLCNKIAGKAVSDPVKIFGCSEIGTSLYDLIMFVDGKSVLAPTLKDIEEMRITHRMTTNYLPIGLGEKDSMRYEGLKTVTQVMIASLYYYAYHDYKLIRCKHCGKWFATKNLIEKYCTRNSPFAGYESYSCKNAVKTIKDMLDKKRISEYERLRVKAAEYGANSRHNQVFNDFCVSCGSYKAALKKGASVELLQEYKEFLFDSANVRPKYGRIKNW